jgi:NAD(P)-dependent dehydrogenase (short-subunit alcohol dehydrogenase family)
MNKIALVTGANRGIGFEVCRQLGQRKITVYLGARDAKKGQDAASQLQREGIDARALVIDVTHPESIREAASRVEKESQRLDILINNAGGNFDYGVPPSQTDLNFFDDTMALNLKAPWQVSLSFLSLLKKSRSGRIVNVSSGAGSFADLTFGIGTSSGVTSYSISKIALNALTVKLALELRESRILVNAVCPGFTATYPEAEKMGARPVADGARSVVWAAVIPDEGPTGGFFRDGNPIGW